MYHSPIPLMYVRAWVDACVGVRRFDIIMCVRFTHVRVSDRDIAAHL